MATPAQIQDAIRRAQSAGDTAAVEDLQGRLAQSSGDAYLRDDGTEWMEGYSPADEVGPMEAFWIGAGRTADKAITGVTDLVASDAEQASTAQEQAYRDQAYSDVQEQHPVAATAGEVAGYAPTVFVPGGAAAQIAAGGATGAAMYNQPEDRAKQGAVDAAITAIPYGGGHVLKRTMAAHNTRLANRAKELGWNLTPGEALDSAGLRALEASMESFPPTAGPMRARKAGRQEAMNQAALSAIGESGNDFADDALLAARARIGEVFDSVIKAKEFPIDNDFLTSLSAIEDTTRSGILGGGETGKIIDRILDAAAKGDGTVTGQELQQWRTTLQTAANKAARSDTATSEYTKALGDMGGAIDDVITRNLDGDELKAWQQARKEWTAIKQLEKAKAIDETGNVRGRKLANNLSGQDTQGYLRGANKSDLYDAARLSRAYAPMADSGTASRLAIPQMLGVAATSPVSVPLMGAANLAARAYANPAAAVRPVTAGLRGYINPGEERPKSKEQILAEMMRAQVYR